MLRKLTAGLVALMVVMGMTTSAAAQSRGGPTRGSNVTRAVPQFRNHQVHNHQHHNGVVRHNFNRIHHNFNGFGDHGRHVQGFFNDFNRRYYNSFNSHFPHGGGWYRYFNFGF